MTDKNYKPDILNCIANLSNDEVFTPPNIANQMLDLLPEEIWKNPDIKFLDPCCKTGIFLREIAKRLIAGLEPIYPDLQERVIHIMKEQLYGIAITDLTGLMSRRTLYCSKKSNEKYSVAENAFQNNDGNIFFEKIEHTWNEKGNCIYCGVNQKAFDRANELETYAYAFIHKNIKEMFGEMKFDVIIGNPPYQFNDGGNGASAMPLYHKFVNTAKSLKPNYIVMIIPSRWFAGGKGLNEFRNNMLKDTHISEIHDFPNAKDCFSDVDIKGGVCYFLWDKKHHNNCKISTYKDGEVVSTSMRPLLEQNIDTFIRYNGAVSILHKIQKKQEPSFSDFVKPRKPFGLPTNYKHYRDKKDSEHYLKLYGYKTNGFVSESDITNLDWAKKYKVFIAKAVGTGNMGKDILHPFLGNPDEVCTETYLLIGPCENKKSAENIISYMNTKFFHFLLGLKKITQNASSKVFSLIPMQDFSKPWTDKELYEKYNLTKEEINFIESMIKGIK